MRNTIRLTERDLMRLVKRIINEQTPPPGVLTQTGPPSGPNRRIDLKSELENKINQLFSGQDYEVMGIPEICERIKRICSEMLRKNDSANDPRLR